MLKRKNMLLCVIRIYTDRIKKIPMHISENRLRPRPVGQEKGDINLVGMNRLE